MGTITQRVHWNAVNHQAEQANSGSKKRHISGTSDLAPKIPALRFGNQAENANSADVLSQSMDFSQQDWRGAACDRLRKAPHLRHSNFTQAILSGCTLDGKQFQHARFDGAQMTGVYLAMAILEDAQFHPYEGQKTDLRHAFLNGARLSRASFKEALLDNACFSQSSGKMPIFESASLINSTFRECRLLGAQFDWANLQDADLRGSFFNDPNFPIHNDTPSAEIRRFAASFRHAQLSGADFNGSYLVGADFSHADFGTLLLKQAEPTPSEQSKADSIGLARNNNARNASKRFSPFRNTALQHANFTHASLPGVTFPKSHLQFANFTSANLEGADFTSIEQAERLSGAQFKHANLHQANFQNMRLSNIDFTDSNLSNSNLQGIQAHNVQFQHSNLQNAKLQNAQLQNIVLLDVNLQYADLTNANMQRSRFQKASLQGAKLGGTQLQGADFSDASYDEQTQWSGAVYNRYTRFPKGFQPTSDMIYEPVWIDRLGL